MKTLTIKKSWFSDSDARLDATFHLSDGRLTRKSIENAPLGINTLADVTSGIFYGGRAKRNYVENEKVGIPFMGSSDMMKADLNSLKYISKKLTRNLNDFMLKEGWILISRSGTIGNAAYVNKDFLSKAASEHMIRVVSNDKIKSGFLYAYLSSKFGYALMTQGTFGAVIQHIEPDYLADIPIPILPETKQLEIHNLIVEASDLRVEANRLLREAQKILKLEAGLDDLTRNDYEYFGNQSNDRAISTFVRSINEISSTSINAFNYSKRIEKCEKRVKMGNHILLFECLNNNQFFTSGSFKRLELDSPSSIKLINQSDIFHIKKQGKMLARKFVKSDRLVEYGEVIIAGVGTLGEGETFCRTIFANEELEGQLISGEFIRMKTNDKIPSGYLFAWLSSDYGFRFIRKTHTGTKLCRPIQDLLKLIPVPIISEETMSLIDKKVKNGHTLMYNAICKENTAISLIENEIESWQS